MRFYVTELTDEVDRGGAVNDGGNGSGALPSALNGGVGCGGR